MESIQTMLQKQQLFFATQETKSISYRISQLKKLYQLIKANESRILLALKSDLNKSEFEAYETELGMVYEELKFMLRHLPSLTRRKKVRTPLMHFPSKSYQYQDPYGCVLIMSPWNYPFQLTMVPLIGAMAAGNCIIVKPSNYAKETSKVMKDLLSHFPLHYLSVVEGGREVNQQLLEEKFDYIFFTGSPLVGKLVMEKAAAHLTPVTLELGGKSPCIIDETADIKLAAKRVAWGKLLNAGQTCVAPDYVIVHERVKEEFIHALVNAIETLYGHHPEQNKEYPKIITQHHFDRLCDLIQESENVIGGTPNHATQQIAPAILCDCDWNSTAMQEELFGPILPILTYQTMEDVITHINQRPKPLALYCFTNSKTVESKIITSISFGGGCINDTIIHLANPWLSFGGVGESGMGRYHGRESFHTFSHTKSMIKKGTWLDIPLRYAPNKDHLKVLKMILRS